MESQKYSTSPLPSPTGTPVRRNLSMDFTGPDGVGTVFVQGLPSVPPGVSRSPSPGVRPSPLSVPELDNMADSEVLSRVSDIIKTATPPELFAETVSVSLRPVRMSIPFLRGDRVPVQPAPSAAIVDKLASIVNQQVRSPLFKLDGHVLLNDLAPSLKFYDNPGIPFRSHGFKPAPVPELNPKPSTKVPLSLKALDKLFLTTSDLQGLASMQALTLGALHVILQKEELSREDWSDIDVIKVALGVFTRDLAAIATSTDANLRLALRAVVLQGLDLDPQSLREAQLSTLTQDFLFGPEAEDAVSRVLAQRRQTEAQLAQLSALSALHQARRSVPASTPARRPRGRRYAGPYRPTSTAAKPSAPSATASASKTQSAAPRPRGRGRRS